MTQQPRLSEMPSAGPVGLETIVDRFESAWQRGERPDIDDALAGLAATERLAVLLELVHADLEIRLKAGEAARVEDYLRRYPELSGQPALVVELVLAEYRRRRGAEPALSLADYLGRFPHLEAELRALVGNATTWAAAPAASSGALDGEAGPALPNPAAARHFAAGGERLPVVPGYEVLGGLGHGGMGVVYKARQTALKRVVALKMVLGRHPAADDLARFRTEAEAIARLQHPNIVQVHEVGEHAGQPFFSLEYCGGGSLAEKLKGTPLPGRAAAAVVETLARAIQAAHDRQIVHRDLKPANVLLTEDGTPKVTDFGLAKKLDEAGQTTAGAIMGTPSYMAPEQAGGKSGEVGPAADVYALGAILYECLTGRPPFKAATAAETVRQVLQEEPVAPRQVNPGVPRDLETVCLKCLQKDAGRRYATAREVAEDLRRFLADEPIQARPTPAWRRLARWTRRRPALATSVAVSLVALAGLYLLALVYNAQVQKALGEVREARSETEQQREAAKQARADAEGFRTGAARAKTEAEIKLDRARRILFARQLGKVEALWRPDPERGLSLLEDAGQFPPYLRDFTWGYYHHLCKRDDLTLREQPGWDPCLAFSPTGATLAVGTPDGAVRLVDFSGTARVLRSAARSPVRAVAFAPDGQTLASGDKTGVVSLWDVAAGRPRATLKGHTGPVRCLAFSADGKTLATGDEDRQVRLWDAAGGKEQGVLPRFADLVLCLTFAPDGTLLVGDWGGGVTFWDTAAARQQAAPQHFGAAVFALAYAPDGRALAVGTSGGDIHLLDAVTLK
jgi:WD40 repeat protein/tRNA A-37 threonylcarbamoyl transferase component Bud32